MHAARGLECQERGSASSCRSAITSAIAIGAALRWGKKWSEDYAIPLTGRGACFSSFSVLIKAVSSPCCSLEIASAALPPKVRRQGHDAPVLGSRESFNCDVLARDEDVEPHISRSSHCAHFTQEKIRAPKNHSGYSWVPTKTAIS